MAFYTAAFGAHETYRQMADDGVRVLHSRMIVNEGTLMLSDDFRNTRAVQAGASPLMPPQHVLGRALRPGARPIRP